MVKTHLNQPHRFTCVNDSPYPGWWAKVSLFEPGRFKGRVLYLDLDVTVIGNLDDLANYPYPFAGIQDYGRPLVMNSSVMVWDAGYADRVFTEFSKSVMLRLPGDQEWISEKVNVTFFPKRWCPSYKKDILKQRRIPDDARIIVYHGRPKSWDLKPDHLERLND